jgi:hypothetical protein
VPAAGSDISRPMSERDFRFRRTDAFTLPLPALVVGVHEHAAWLSEFMNTRRDFNDRLIERAADLCIRELLARVAEMLKHFRLAMAAIRADLLQIDFK